jgi:hypothetical protein
MRHIIRPDIVRAAATAVVTLALIAPAAAQYRSLPPPPQLPMLPPSPAPMTIPRPPPEIGAPPVLAVPEGEARQTERVCIEKEMCVDVPVSPKGPPSASEPK